MADTAADTTGKTADGKDRGDKRNSNCQPCSQMNFLATVEEQTVDECKITCIVFSLTTGIAAAVGTTSTTTTPAPPARRLV